MYMRRPFCFRISEEYQSAWLRVNLLPVGKVHGSGRPGSRTSGAVVPRPPAFSPFRTPPAPPVGVLSNSTTGPDGNAHPAWRDRSGWPRENSGRLRRIRFWRPEGYQDPVEQAGCRNSTPARAGDAFRPPFSDPLAFRRRTGRPTLGRAAAEWPIPLRTPGRPLRSAAASSRDIPARSARWAARSLPLRRPQTPQSRPPSGWMHRAFGPEGCEPARNPGLSKAGTGIHLRLPDTVPTISSSAPGYNGAPRCPDGSRKRVSTAPRRPGTGSSRSSTYREVREPGSCRYRLSRPVRRPTPLLGDGWI